MTYQTYTHQHLQLKSIAQLKRIYSEIGCTIEVTDKRCKDEWRSAIANYQASKIQKLTPAAPDEQTTAQAELNDYIANQAQAVAPEPLTTREISFYDHEIYSGNHLIATISHDDDLTQPWVVLVQGKEKFRANTYGRCHRFIQWHHQDSTLNEPTQVETPPTTENLIMAHIFNECQNYGFEILDDGIYNNKGVKLGQVGCTDGNWWVKRRYSVQQQYSNSVLDAVRSLSMVDVSTDGKSIFEEYFLDQPLEQLTGDKLQRLLERTELVTA
ncbi:MAG: hypothetical protein RM368_34335 [Nostoc sp. DedSLP03]|uniref:hypothetical protein n=1 Tax=Nostoc sp. DedSLP03 TaxID=3075400 RepID=UPI002AD58F42|nr:hypothetical protein [Nostoc sp. DedSLP03]MDZ7969962.1 hypothetical protein [Nostoc sp. DedSLP03]